VFIDTTTPTETTMTTTSQIPATQNEAWGFWGTMTENAAAAWPMAITVIAEATRQPFESVRIFLDSRHGRHFADDVLNQMHAGHALADAVHAATQQWMGWKIGRQTCKQYGIPRGLPYLAGFMALCGISAEECM
jgi:hypothetical protein